MAVREFSTPNSAIVYLTGRMTEQKKEERRQRFVDDHNLIHSRRKNDVCIPFLPGHDQKSWFSKLETNGIWEKVFEFVTNQSDMTSAYFACEMFRKHLEEKRKMEMLPKVFEVLKTSGYLNYSGFGSQVSEINKEKSRDVLKQRLVCKSWKESAETVYLVPSVYSESFWSFTTRFVPSNPMLCIFKQVEDVNKTIGIMQTSTMCASLIRSVEVRDDYCEDKEIFYSRLLQFLDTHGKSVWDFRYSDSKGINYRNLQSLMARMPNLRNLCLYVHEYGLPLPEPENAGLLEPLPFIPTLEFVRFEWSDPKYEIMMGEILTKNLNLKAVGLNPCLGEHVSQNLWDAMRNLQLEYFHIDSSWEAKDDLLQLEQFDWPLKYLNLRYDLEYVSIEASDLFKVLNKYNDALVKFTVDAGLEGEFDEKKVTVHLPNLESFFISSFIDFNNIIVPCGGFDLSLVEYEYESTDSDYNIEW